MQNIDNVTPLMSCLMVLIIFSYCLIIVHDWEHWASVHVACTHSSEAMEELRDMDLGDRS